MDESTRLATATGGLIYDPLHVPGATIDSGPIEGFYSDGVCHFLGIPYARPPVGNLREHRPVPVEPWKDYRKCILYGPRCPQGTGSCYPPSPEAHTTSEDCLYLNVWRVQGCKGAPVIVFIHGNGVDTEGDFATGSGSETASNGAELAKQGAVVVTFNYCLGAFGFIAHPALGANFGLWDQIAALGWVKRNILQLGGDPNNVTLVGSSTGAESVRRLMGSCIFHRAILQSGGFELPINTRSTTYAEAACATLELFKELGRKSGTHDIDQLRMIPAPVVHEISQALLARRSGHSLLHITKRQLPILWGPVVEEDSEFSRSIERWPSHIPIMLGCTGNEVQYADIKQRWSHTQRLYHSGETNETQMSLPETLKTVASDFFGPSTPRVYDSISQGDQADCLDRLLAAAHFLEPCLATARRRLASGPPNVYVYHFTRYRNTVGDYTSRSSRPPSVFLNHKGTPKHASEIPYVFGNLQKVYGADSDSTVDPIDLEISDEMQHSWLTFAIFGVPLLKDGSTWPQFNGMTLPTMWFGAGVTRGSYPLMSGMIKMLEEERRRRRLDAPQVLERAEHGTLQDIVFEGGAKHLP